MVNRHSPGVDNGVVSRENVLIPVALKTDYKKTSPVNPALWLKGFPDYGH